MAITEPYELDGVSVGTSELSIISQTTTLQNATTAGVYYPCIDGVQAAVAKGDRFFFRVYEKVRSASTKRVAYRFPVSHAQSQPVMFPPMMLMNGFDFTLQKDAGTDRSWDASVRAVTGGVTEAAAFNASVSTTELSIITGTSSLATDGGDGFYQLWVDANAMSKGDEFEIAIYETIEGSTGTKRKILTQRLTDTQCCLWFSPILCLVNGWDMTLKKIAGTDRTIEATIRKVT